MSMLTTHPSTFHSDWQQREEVMCVCRLRPALHDALYVRIIVYHHSRRNITCDWLCIYSP
jgi:hypothetical protein